MHLEQSKKANRRRAMRPPLPGAPFERLKKNIGRSKTGTIRDCVAAVISMLESG